MYYSSVSVQQLKQRKGKPWRARLSYKDADGKWKQITKMLPEATGKREAEKQAKAWKDEMNAIADNMAIPDNDKTVAQMYEEYLEFQYNTGEIQASTYNVQLENFNKYTKPILGNYLFATLDKVAIVKWIKHINSINLSQNTIHTVYSQFKKLYTHYYEVGDLLKDPFKGITTPKKGESRITRLDKEDTKSLIGAINDYLTPDDPMYCGIYLALYAGLRRGEICGLRWRDIDFDRETLSVSTSIGIAKGGEYTKNPKNESSIRTFPLTPQLYEVLKQRYDLIKPEPNYFVIGNKTTFMSVSRYSRRFKQFIDDYGLTDAYDNAIKPHSLRHNMAFVGIRSGMDIASLSKMMGHASRSMTLDTYGDASPDAIKTAMEKLALQFDDDTDLATSDETAEKLYALQQKHRPVAETDEDRARSEEIENNRHANKAQS